MTEADDQAAVEAPRLIQFLAGVGSRNDCPLCGSDRWSLPAGHDGVATEFKLEPANSHTAVAIPTYVLICENCGFVRLHARVVTGGAKP